MGLKRTGSVSGNHLNDLGGSNQNGFFLRHEEWKRLNVPEKMRTSILERSNTISNEFSLIVESNQDITLNQENDVSCLVSGSGDDNRVQTPVSSVSEIQVII